MNPVSEFQPLSLMISSRCRDKVLFGGRLVEMTVVRKEIKRTLEAIRPSGVQLFDVWIHEDESQTSARESTWDTCMRRARQSDVVLVLYNGNSGWSGSHGEVRDHVGICHAEFAEAYDKAADKVRCIQFDPVARPKKGSPDEAFQQYFKSQDVPANQVSTGDEAVEAAAKLAIAAILSLARAGVGVNSLGKYFSGEALKWTRLDFQARREVTRNAVVEFLSARYNGGKQAAAGESIVICPVSGKKVAFVCDCIPSTLGTAGARELVGQPFLKDHVIARNFPEEVAGPVHLIACQKGVTESQAIRQLGFPDAVVVSAPFGVYVVDDVQKIQMVFIAQCRDQTTTRLKVQLFLRWIEGQGEDKLLAERAGARRRIADLIADIQ